MDTAPPSVPDETPARDWSLLPIDALSTIFVRVGIWDVLMGAGLVCRSWLQAAKLPDVWRVVDMENDVCRVLYDTLTVYEYPELLYTEYDVLRAMAKEAVHRSGGQLRVFAGKDFVTEELIQYIVERSPSLTTLRLVSCDDEDFGEGLARAIRESPPSELRSLELHFVNISVEELTTVLENCPAMEALKVSYCSGIDGEDEYALRARFAGINSLTIELDDGFSDYSDLQEIHGGDDDVPWTW